MYTQITFETSSGFQPYYVYGVKEYTMQGNRLVIILPNGRSYYASNADIIHIGKTELSYERSSYLVRESIFKPL